jgi:hypothetical protein
MYRSFRGETQNGRPGRMHARIKIEMKIQSIPLKPVCNLLSVEIRMELLSVESGK